MTPLESGIVAVVVALITALGVPILQRKWKRTDEREDEAAAASDALWGRLTGEIKRLQQRLDTMERLYEELRVKHRTLEDEHYLLKVEHKIVMSDRDALRARVVLLEEQVKG